MPSVFVASGFGFVVTESIDFVALVADLSNVGLLVFGLYLGLTGKVVSRFHYEEMKRSYKTQIEYWRRKCGSVAAGDTPTYGGDDT